MRRFISIGGARTFLGGLVRLATLVGLGVHFGLTVLYVMPVNPLKLELQPYLAATIGTFFPQNWSLFAPNPIESDYALLVHCLGPGEAADGALPVEGWRDLSSPLWHRFQSNRLSAYDRLARPHGAAIRTFLAGDSAMLPWLEGCRKGDDHACDFYRDRLQEARDRSARLLGRIGSAFCAETEAAAEPTNRVAVRVRETRGVPWSRRHDDQAVAESRDLEVGIFPLDRSVRPSGLYRGGEAR